MQLQPTPLAIAKHPHSFCRWASFLVNIGGVADQQISSWFGLPRLLPMRLTHGLKRHVIAIKKAIGSFQVSPIGILLR